MALVLKDRVKETTTTTGTGTLTLLGAATGYQSFSAIGNGNTCYYAISSTGGPEWEVGLGTYNSGTLTRDTILSSSAAGAAVDLSAGTKDVYVVYPAGKSIYEEGNGTVLFDGGPITVIGNNVTSYTQFTQTLSQMYANVNNFAQSYVQNLNDGTEASSDFAAYNSLSDGNTYFVDMGISSPNAASTAYPNLGPNVGYVISYGDGASNVSDLYLGSGDGKVVVFAGAFDSNNTVATFGTDLSTALEGSLNVAGNVSITGVTTLNALAYTAGNIAAAANNTVLVTKQYVDDATSNGFHVHTPVLVATTGNLTANYNNGSSGVGATLTNSGTQVALSIDGVSMNVNDRVLVWQQTSGLQNGVYVVTTVGSGSTNWVLTRAADADTAGENNPDELGGGDYFFVQSGNTLGYHSFICTNSDTITFGTTAITFSEFSQVPVYTGGTNINVNGQVISLTGTVGPTNGGTGVNTVATGDLLYGSGTNTWAKLPKGSAYKSLVMNAGGTNVEWNAIALDQSGAVSGTLDEVHGGTGQSSYAIGDLLYSPSANTLTKLPGNTTTTKKFLQQTGTGSASAAPAWGQPAASDITGLAPSATTDTTNASNITSGTLANARTTATASNGANTIVARDVNGSFAANLGAFTSVTGNGSGLTALNASAISTGTLDNARTSAASANGASTIVARDASGNFSANTITATTFSGAVSGSGAGLTNLNASAITTGTLDNARTSASSTNGANTIVARDASGNFAANTVTANLTGTASNATVLQTARNFSISNGATAAAVSFNGSAAIDLNVTALNASVLSAGTVPSARVSGSYTGITGVGTLTAGTWNATAITDTYLATISTAGKVANSATTATASNGASTIVARDANGSFAANVGTFTTITGAGSGVTSLNASNLASGTVPDARFPATLPAVSGANLTSLNATALASGTVPDARFPATLPAVSGANLTSLNASNISAGTLANARTTAASANGANTIVARDASGNFSAGTITATLSGNASTATTATNQSGGTVNATTGAFSTSVAINSAQAYLFLNRNSAASGQVGVQFQNGGTTAWWNYLDTNATSMTWYNSTAVANVMSLTTGGVLSTTGGFSGSGASLTSLNASSISTGTLATARGGTGLGSFTSGGAVYATSTSALTTGTLPVASGGTGLTTLASTRIPYGGGTSAFQSSANLLFNGSALSVGDGNAWGTVNINAGDGNHLYFTSTTNLELVGSITQNGTTGYLTYGSNNFVSMAAFAGHVFNCYGSERVRIEDGLSVGTTTSPGLGGVIATGGYRATSAAPFFMNATTVSSSFTLPSSYNAMSTGPITVNSGVTVTVPTGSTWTVV